MSKKLIYAVIAIGALFGSAAYASEDSSDYSETILQAKQAMTKQLKDPDSVKFADLFASRGSPHIICGLVNARNSYGGYTGMTPFTYYADTGKIVVAQGSTNQENIKLLKTFLAECRK